MDQTLLEKVKTALVNNGVDEEIIAKTLDELAAETEEEEAEAIPVPDDEEQPLPPEEVVKEEEELAEVPPQPDEVANPMGNVNLDEFVARLDQLELDNGELKKANEGLLAEISSLKEALKEAGVIQGQTDDSFGGRTPEIEGSNPPINVMDGLLRVMNGGKKY